MRTDFMYIFRKSSEKGTQSFRDIVLKSFTEMEYGTQTEFRAMIDSNLTKLTNLKMKYFSKYKKEINQNKIEIQKMKEKLTKEHNSIKENIKKKQKKNT
jgi:gas vesicle protein